METEPRADSAAAPNASRDVVGRFRYDVPNDVLEWSDAVYEIYGWEPGATVPTIDLLSEQCHPDDRAAASETLRRTLASGSGCVHAHRIITPAEVVKHVVIVGSSTRDGDSAPVEFTGYAVDVTDRTETVVAQSLTTALHEVLDGRAVIEQAKGAMMLAFGVDAETAFSVLSWQSQQNNIKLRQLAGQIVRDVQDKQVLGDDVRDVIGSLILTAHERARARI